MKHLFLTSLFLLVTQPVVSAQNLTEYIVKIYPDQPYKVGVKAKFRSKVDTLDIHPACPNYDYPNGWSTFINPTNSTLRFIGNSKWQLSKQDEVEYEVDLSFIKERWEVGNEQAGILINGTVFLVTRALFLINEQDTKFKISFDIPENYYLATSWSALGNDQFLVNSIEELNNNTVVWGRQEIENIKVGDFNLQIALLGYDRSIRDLVKATFHSVLNQYIRIFPQTPPANYLITVFPFEQNDGEAYTSSNAFTLNLPISNQTRLVWANQFAHELFHHWNGRMINGPERQSRQWFSEGFTEYFANLTLLWSGVISKDEFLRIIEKNIGPYFYFRNRQYPDVSLVKAGESKSKYRFGVYNGGWCAAFVLDIMIREKYPDKTLEHFMNDLFINYGITDTAYTISDLEKAIREYLGKEENFFERYIAGTDEMPVEYFMNKLGILIDNIPYEAITFLFIDQNSDGIKKLLRNQWLKE